MSGLAMFLLYNCFITGILGGIWNSTGFDRIVKTAIWVDCIISFVFLLMEFGVVLAPGMRVL